MTQVTHIYDKVNGFKILQPWKSYIIVSYEEFQTEKADEVTYFLQERNVPGRIENIQSVTKERQ